MILIVAMLVVASISFTISVTSIFDFMREYIKTKSRALSELILCPYCVSHYVTFVLLLTSDIQTFRVSNVPVYQFLFTLFAIVGGSGIIHYVLIHAYEPIKKYLRLKEMEDNEEI